MLLRNRKVLASAALVTAWANTAKKRSMSSKISQSEAKQPLVLLKEAWQET